MNEEDRKALVASLSAAREKLEYEINLQSNKIVEAQAKMADALEQDRFLVGMLAHYGHVVPEAGVPALLPPPKLSENPTADEVAARWIVDYGLSDTARRWCEWLLETKRVPSPSPVAAYFDKFPLTLKQQYNPDRNKAIEALRAQVNSWIEKGVTNIRYLNSQVHEPEPEKQQVKNLTAATNEWHQKDAKAKAFAAFKKEGA
jgi:hypothetical protein